MSASDPTDVDIARDPSHLTAAANSMVRVEMPYADARDFFSTYWKMTHGAQDASSCRVEVSLLSSEFEGFRSYQDDPEGFGRVSDDAKRKKIARDLLQCAALLALLMFFMFLMGSVYHDLLLRFIVSMAFAGSGFFLAKMMEVKAREPALGSRGWVKRLIIGASFAIALLLVFIFGFKLALDALDWFVEVAHRLVDSYPSYSSAGFDAQ